MAVLAVLVVVAAAMVVLYITNTKSVQAVSNITCDSGEQLAVHYHAHLAIINEGTEINVPANVGINNDFKCLYWLHTHDTTGVIHIESPKAQSSRTFTLGDFFAVWNQPLSTTQVATIKLGKDQKLVVYVDGTRQPDGTDPRKIPLKAHTQVVLEITPPAVDPPPAYTFPSGL